MFVLRESKLVIKAKSEWVLATHLFFCPEVIVWRENETTQMASMYPSSLIWCMRQMRQQEIVIFNNEPINMCTRGEILTLTKNLVCDYECLVKR